MGTPRFCLTVDYFLTNVSYILNGLELPNNLDAALWDVMRKCLKQIFCSPNFFHMLNPLGRAIRLDKEKDIKVEILLLLLLLFR